MRGAAPIPTQRQRTLPRQVQFAQRAHRLVVRHEPVSAHSTQVRDYVVTARHASHARGELMCQPAAGIAGAGGQQVRWAFSASQSAQRSRRLWDVVGAPFVRSREGGK